MALLDPAEFAEGVDGEQPVVIDDLAGVEHHGRPGEAVLRPTAAHDPRCSCCPLLFSAGSDRWDVEAGAPSALDARPGLPVRHRRVRVLTAEIGGDRPGGGDDASHRGRRHAMPDALFAPVPE